MPNLRTNRRWGNLVLVAAVVVSVLAAYRLLWHGRGERLVVYCAHDAVYAEKVLAEFEKRSGISVSLVPDTEATKSLGLVETLIREREASRCDVFWNNQLLGTLQLAEAGILLPYKGPGFERMPAAFKDREGRWAGFGARLRVYIVNTERLAPQEQAVKKALEGDLSRVVIAKPLYGTTLSHYSVLAHEWGLEKLKAWHGDLRRRGICEVMGNAQVKDLVARGKCDVGLTDTDDYFVARDEGEPVAMVPIRLEDGSVICIPNTVCIIKGTKRLGAAKKLVDYLLSEECEVALAGSRSRQIPLGPVKEELLPPEVRELRAVATDSYPLAEAFPARAACLMWLKSEYVE